MNTKIHVLYRDPSNYKDSWPVVFKGRFSSEDIERLEYALDEGTYFIPGDAGLAPYQMSVEGTGDDHPWHELDVNAIELTDEAPTDPRTFSEFVDAMVDAAEAGWKGATEAEVDDALWPTVVRIRNNDPERFARVPSSAIGYAIRRTLEDPKYLAKTRADIYARLEAEGWFDYLEDADDGEV